MLAFLAMLPVTKIWGVGKRTEQVLARAGFRTIGDIQRATEPGLAAVVGANAARDIWQLAHGQDDRPVATDWEEKSISTEETFDVDCADPDVLSQTLLELVERVGARLRQAGKLARTGQIKVRFGDFSTITRQRAFSASTNTDRGLLRCARELYEREHIQRPVRLLGSAWPTSWNPAPLAAPRSRSSSPRRAPTGPRRATTISIAPWTPCGNASAATRSSAAHGPAARRSDHARPSPCSADRTDCRSHVVVSEEPR